MISIAQEYECARNNVVREHLPMVFPAFFNIHNDDLLEPECKLNEIVPLGETIHLSDRPADPELFEV